MQRQDGEIAWAQTQFKNKPCSCSRSPCHNCLVAVRTPPSAPATVTSTRREQKQGSTPHMHAKPTVCALCPLRCCKRPITDVVTMYVARQPYCSIFLLLYDPSYPPNDFSSIPIPTANLPSTAFHPFGALIRGLHHRPLPILARPPTRPSLCDRSTRDCSAEHIIAAPAYLILPSDVPDTTSGNTSLCTHQPRTPSYYAHLPPEPSHCF